MDLKTIEASARVGQDAQVQATAVQLGRRVYIGDRVRIEVERLALGDDVRIDADVTIRAETFQLGQGSRIETRCVVAGMGGPCHYVRIGEQTLIGHDSKLLVPAAAIGDYTAVHHHTLLNGRKPLVMGHNVWIGQNCVINSEDWLTIGNHVGIGAYSSVYTHGYFGDLLEGCRVFKLGAVRIEDDAWILGCYNIISPGVTLGEKCLVLTGSNVTRSVPANHTVGGAPARDMTGKLVPYRDVPPEEKFEKIRAFLREYVETCYPGGHEERADGFVVHADDEPFRILLLPRVDADTDFPAQRPLLVFAGRVNEAAPPAGVTVFDLHRRQYTRARSSAEIRTITFLKSYRARFVPADQPRVLLPDEYRDSQAH